MREISLTQGKVALVDDEDYHRVSQHRWHASVSKQGGWYARTNMVENGRRVTTLLHRFVLDFSNSDPDVDHRDLNGLNNRRYNLRETTKSGNASNSHVRKDSVSGIKGVRWCPKHKRWAAQITAGRKQIWLGYYESIDAASRAYAEAATKHFGEFARAESA